MRSVGLWRGINVGKAKRVPMADLRAVLESLGCNEVRTLLNSGNAVFDAPHSDLFGLGTEIRTAVAARCDVDAAVLLLSAEQLERIAAQNPFLDRDLDPSRVLVSFLLSAESRQSVQPLLEEKFEPDEFALGELASYTSAPSGVLESSALRRLEKVLRGGVTTRNWRTVSKLVTML